MRSFEYENNVFTFELDDETIEYHKSQNLEYHTLYKNNILSLDDDNDVILKTSFTELMNILKEKADINFDKKTITLYRMLGLESIEDLEVPLGKYWAFDMEIAEIFDDVGYEHFTNKSKHKDFILKATYTFDSVDWGKVADIYLMNDFREAEVRLYDDAIPLSLKYLNNEKWIELNSLFVDNYDTDVTIDKSSINNIECIEKDINLKDLNIIVHNMLDEHKKYEQQKSTNIQEENNLPNEENINKVNVYDNNFMRM